MRVNIREAKTNLSKLIERARRGEEVVIAKAGKPVVMLTVIEEPRVFGSAKGKVKFHKGWDAPLSGRKLAEFLGLRR
jgi:prevent-host-death family protein